MTALLSQDMITDVDHLDRDHRAILVAIRDLRAELEEYPVDAGPRAVERLREVIEVMWKHMEREEMYLWGLRDTCDLDVHGHIACHDVFRRWTGDFLGFLTSHPDVVAAGRCAGFLDRWYVRHLAEEDGRMKQGTPEAL